jgi:hypothetical protein
MKEKTNSTPSHPSILETVARGIRTSGPDRLEPPSITMELDAVR